MRGASPLALALAAFVFVSSIAPATLQFLRLGLLLTALVLSLPRLMTQSLQSWTVPIARRHLLLVLAVGAYGSILGFVNETPGASEIWRVWVLWPLLLGLTFLGLRTALDFRVVYAALDVALSVVSVLVITLALRGASWLPSAVIGSGGATYNATQSQVTYPVVLSLTFLVPYGLARLFIDGKARLSRSNAWQAVGVGLGCIAVVIGGQRSTLLGVAFAGLLILISLWTPGRTGKQRTVVLMILFAGATVLAGRLSGVDILTLVGKVGGATERSDAIRSEQMSVLFAEASSRPIRGWGYGHSVPGYLRSVTSPWSYELLPLLILMSVGILGLMAYMWVAGSLSLALFRARSRPLVTPALAGSGSLLLASIFNPATTKLGAMWGLFLAAAVANFVMCQQNPSRPVLNPAIGTVNGTTQ